jgi:fructokinase
MRAAVVVIGDAVVDILEEPDGTRHRFPGGAALNTAVGLSILGHPVAQVAAVGQDRDGFWLERYLRDHHVRLVRARSCDFTGVATSRRVDGEPTYTFTAALVRRRLSPPDSARYLVAEAPAVVVNSYPFDDTAQVDALCSTLSLAGRLRVLDPNPREALIRDRAAYLAGFERTLAHVDVLKISEQDLTLVYDGSEADAVGRISACGPTAVLLTRGARGATLLRPGHTDLHADAVLSSRPVVDALGAGDATLAAFVSRLLQLEGVASDAELDDALRFAMVVAAETARHPGGRLRLP